VIHLDPEKLLSATTAPPVQFGYRSRGNSSVNQQQQQHNSSIAIREEQEFTVEIYSSIQEAQFSNLHDRKCQTYNYE
jgi:hypothetical protein